MKRLALLAAAVVAVTETYRRGYTAPLLFGARLWINACKWTEATTETEADYLA